MSKSSMVCILLGMGREHVFVACIVSQMVVAQRGLGNFPFKVGILGDVVRGRGGREIQVVPNLVTKDIKESILGRDNRSSG